MANNIKGAFELENCTNVLLAEIANPESTQTTVAKTYRLAMLSSQPTDWGVVNRAIMNRWTRSALERVKGMAHRG